MCALVMSAKFYTVCLQTSIKRNAEIHWGHGSWTQERFHWQTRVADVFTFDQVLYHFTSVAYFDSWTYKTNWILLSQAFWAKVILVGKCANYWPSTVRKLPMFRNRSLVSPVEGLWQIHMVGECLIMMKAESLTRLSDHYAQLLAR